MLNREKQIIGKINHIYNRTYWYDLLTLDRGFETQITSLSAVLNSLLEFNMIQVNKYPYSNTIIS